jgi:hypothetical protein
MTVTKSSYCRRCAAVERQGLRLAGVVGEHQRAHIVGHRAKQRVSFDPAGQDALLEEHVQEDLDVHLVVRHVDARGVVDRVGVEPPAAQPVLDPGLLGHAEIAALGDDVGLDHVGVDADAVVGAIADVGILFRGRLHVGADAAVVEEVDIGGEDMPDDFLAAGRLGVDAETFAHRRAERNRLRGAVEDPAAGADHRRIVVAPGRAGQLEQRARSA